MVGRGVASGSGIDRLSVCAFCQTYTFLKCEEQSGREHGFYGIVNRAEISLPHPKRQTDPFLIQYRPVVQNSVDRLQGRSAHGRTAPCGQYDPLGSAVAVPERDQHPFPHTDSVLQLLRYQIVIGAVDGVYGFGDRYLSHRSFHAPALPISHRQSKASSEAQTSGLLCGYS